MKRTTVTFFRLTLTFAVLLFLASCGEKVSEDERELAGIYELESFMAHGGKSYAEQLEINAAIELKSDKSGVFNYKRYGYEERGDIKWNGKHITFLNEEPVEFEWRLKNETLTLKQVSDGDSKVLIFKRAAADDRSGGK